MIDHDGYKHDGVYMSFDHYNVEGRERVFCVTGASGVPYSTQWAKKPYPYAIQISQFGLSHFSKFVRSRNSKPEQRIVGMDKGDWEIAEDCMLKTEREYTLGFSCPARKLKFFQFSLNLVSFYQVFQFVAWWVQFLEFWRLIMWACKQYRNSFYRQFNFKRIHLFLG